MKPEGVISHFLAIKYDPSVLLLLFFQSNGSILIEIQLLINLAVDLQGQAFSKAIFFLFYLFRFFPRIANFDGFKII